MTGRGTVWVDDVSLETAPIGTSLHPRQARYYPMTPRPKARYIANAPFVLPAPSDLDMEH